MHTSAQQRSQMVMRAFVWEGTLLHKAEARTKVLDGHDHAIPVVCMDVELDNALHSRMHVEQPYPMGEFDRAHADAAKLKKGMRIQVEAPVLDLCLVARNATQVTPLSEPAAPKPSTPTTNPQEPELWPA